MRTGPGAGGELVAPKREAPRTPAGRLPPSQPQWDGPGQPEPNGNKGGAWPAPGSGCSPPTASLRRRLGSPRCHLGSRPGVGGPARRAAGCAWNQDSPTFAPRDARAQARGRDARREVWGGGLAGHRPRRHTGDQAAAPRAPAQAVPLPSAPLSRRERRSWSWETAGTAPAALGERGAYRTSRRPSAAPGIYSEVKEKCQEEPLPRRPGSPAALPLPAALALQRRVAQRRRGGRGGGEVGGVGRRAAGRGEMRPWSPFSMVSRPAACA